MQYIYSDDPISHSANYLSNVIVDALKTKRHVLWLLSGGSSIPIAIKASQNLKDMDLSNLYISMTDERYGKPSHANENWQQLLDGSLVLGNANYWRILNNQSIQKETEDFSDWLANQLKLSDCKIGIFGMGPDGHTCGIKPHSPAVKSNEFAAYFTGDDFERITITPKTVEQIDYGIIQISGSNKKQALSNLINQELDTDTMPAQVLKRIKNSIIFTDIKKEEL